MAGVYKLEIEESSQELKELLREQKTASAKERVQLLYLLKTEQAKTVQEAAQMLGRHRVTVQEWLRKYREGGMKRFLEAKVPTGRPGSIPVWAQQALNKQLQEPEGFASYQAICDWMETHLGIEAPYKTVYKLVHYRLKACPKVPRPVSANQSPEQLEAFKKNSLKPSAC